MNKKSIWIFTIFLVSGFAVDNQIEAQEDTCKSACDQYVTCTGEMGPRKPTKAEEKKLFLGCMNTCKKHKTEVQACHTQMKKANNSCQVFYQCVLKTYQNSKNK